VVRGLGLAARAGMLGTMDLFGMRGVKVVVS